jgi:chromosome partition protein MukF
MFFIEEETLTRESLTVLTNTLQASLANIVAAAAGLSAPDDWRTQVVTPLRVTVADLVGGIQRRQRGFDVQQEDLQREIAELLTADWFGAVGQCQSLLDATSATLGELNHMLLHGASQLQATLQEIQELAVIANADDAELAVRHVMDQIDRIAAWGSARQSAWSEYHQYVHRFLRDVVRLDPSRVLTHRLRDLLAGRAGRPFALAVAAAPPIRLLRAVTPPAGAKPEVKRRKPAPDKPIEEVPADDPQARLDADVRGAIAAGAHGLREITAKLTSAMDPRERFVAAGRIAGALARVSDPDAAAERPWVDVNDAFQIEEWKERSAE